MAGSITTSAARERSTAAAPLANAGTNPPALVNSTMNGSEKSFEENNGQETGGGGGESAEASEIHAAVSGASGPSNPGLMTVTSDEVNYLIFRYLQECGFVHSAFTFAHESMLGRTGLRSADKSLPPGALITFLQKGLQYVTLEERLVAGADDGAAIASGQRLEASDVSLLSGLTLGALTREQPVIQLNVPPATAAAALKAKLEAESKIATEQLHKQPPHPQALSVTGTSSSSNNMEASLSSSMSHHGPLAASAAASARLAPSSLAAVAASSGVDANLAASSSVGGGRDNLHQARLARQALAAQAAAAQAAAAAMSQLQQQMLAQQQTQQHHHPGVLPTHVMDHPLFHQQLQQQAELLALHQQQQQAALGGHPTASIAESALDATGGQGKRSAVATSAPGVGGQKRGPKKSKKSNQDDSSNSANSTSLVMTASNAQPLHVGASAIRKLPEDDESSRGSDMDEDDDNENNVDDEAENDTAMETDDRAGRRQIDHALDAAVVATMPGAQAAGLPQLVNGEYDKNGELLVTSSQSRAVGKGVPHSPHRNGGRSSESDGEPPPPHAEQPGGGLPEVDDTSTAALPDEILQLQMHESEVFMCAWNPVFTNLIATGSGDASARIWEMNEGTAKAGIHSVKTLPHGTDPLDKKNKDVTTLEWSSDGQFLATGSYDGIARVWARNGELLHTLRRHTGPIFSLKWNRKGNYILSGSYDTTAIVWDVSEPKPDPVVQQFTDHEAPTLDVDWRDNGTFATCSTDKKVHIYMVGMPKPLKVYSGHKDEVNAVKWDPSGRLLASCSDDSTAKVWEVDNDRDGPLYDFTSHTQEIYTVKWSPTGVGSSNPEMQSLLATASFDGTVRLWSVLDGSCFRIFDRHRDSVYSVAFSPSGKFLASGSLAGQMYIWNIERGEHVKSFKGSGDIFEVAWNKEETMVAACFSSNVVAIMDFDRASVIRKGSSS